MIDDDFSPNRLQYRALGHLLVRANNDPQSPALREVELLTKVYGRNIDSRREEWLTELVEHGLVRIVPDAARTGDRLGTDFVNVCITPAGVYYVISRASLIAGNARTPLDEYPDDIVDTPWALQSYFSSSDEDMAPASDRFIRFDDNQEAYDAALGALDEVSHALASDNEIGSTSPEERDEKLAELRAIRQLLEKREGWQSKLVAASWGVLGYLMSHFADHPIAYLADRAWNALKVMLGLQ